MKLEEIQKLIEQDSVIDQANLDRESVQIPYLHAKWYKIFSEELRTFHGLELEYKSVRKDKFLYYTGKAPDEVYVEHPLDHRILKGDLDTFMDADPELIRLQARIDLQKIKIRTIEEFLKQINQRSFNIRNAIEFMKFKSGVG